MASILLASAGAAIGGSIGGSILGVSTATIGGAVGSFAGSVIDSWIISSLAPGQRIDGSRLDNLQITTSTEGAVIPRIYGRMRVGGNIIWATDFTETISTSTQGGGKGGGPSVTTTAYLYSASFAVALVEGPITGIGRIWADGKPLDLSGVTCRIYQGDEAQQPDPFIEVKMGAGLAPAYRSTAYVMFEELSLEQFGNRIPQLSFEVFRPINEPDTAEGMVRVVTLIPGSGEFIYATEPVSRGTGGNTASENVHSTTAVPDIVAALDQLQAAAPNLESVSLVVSWFGTDLRAGSCQILPGVENTTKVTSPKSWLVNGVSRTDAHVISFDASGRSAYGGTPADFAVVQAIQELKARGLRVTFYPFLLMDIPDGNSLPDPYSDNAATIGQGTYPWRGRITCSPAAGYIGTVDKTAGAGTQASAFMGSAQPSNFIMVNGEGVTWTGGSDWGFRRLILHYAHLCAVAGGVDTFLIGSELRGLTTIRDGATIANGATTPQGSHAMTTPNLALPYLAAAQSQKHVTVNEAFDALDGLVQLSVISAALTAPPGSPAEGDRYIIASGATGAWTGWDASIARSSGGAWLRLIPQTGWLAWNAAGDTLLVWTGSAWTGLDVTMKLLTRAASVRVAQAPAGSATEMVVTEDLLSGLSGALVTSAVTIPNRAIVLGVSNRTVTTIAGATSYDCGISGQTSKFGGSLGIAAGSTNVGVIGPQAFYGATPIILTANGGNFSGGAVRIAIHYLLPIAPQS